METDTSHITTTSNDQTEPTPLPGILKKPSNESDTAASMDGNDPATSPRDEEEVHKPKRVPPWKLFRFANCFDIILLILGIITTIIGSAGIPIHLYLFGETLNQFVYYSQAVDVSTISQLPDNTTCSPTLFIQNPQLLTRATGTGTNSSEAFFCNASQDSSAERIISNVLDYVCDPRSTLQREVGMVSIYYVIMGVVVLTAVFCSTVFWNLSAYRQTRRMRQAFYQSALRQEIGWFDLNNPSELTTRLIDDVEKIQAGIGDKMAIFLQNISYSIGCLIVGFTVSWKMTLVVACMFPVLIGFVFVSIVVIGSFAGKQQAALASAGAFAEEKLSLIRTVVAFGGEKIEGKNYGEKLKTAFSFGIKTSFFTSFFVGGTYFIFFSSYALGFWYGSTLIIACELAAGDVVIVFFSVFYACAYVADSLPDVETIAVAFGSAAAVFEIIDREPVIDLDKGEPVEDLEGNITFSDVIFHYPARPDVPILRGLDLEVKKGQTVALVGPSGSGKSTVVQLIQRFYNPVAGQITVDGKEIQDLNLGMLRKKIGVVSQNPVLFNTTILENIRFGRVDATLDDVEMAARNANAHDFILQLPEGYNTQVGERGTQLSGGQKQRIAIARALVRNPKILLLDEATSALDNKSEKVVQEALDKASEGRTTIIIAHRLSTIQTADVIVALDEGRVVESGTHAELLAKEGLYHELLTAQTFDEEIPKDTRLLSRFKAAVKKAIVLKRFNVNRGPSFGNRNYSRRVSVMSNTSSTSGQSFRSSIIRRKRSSRHSQQRRGTRKLSTITAFSDHLRKVGIGDISAVKSGTQYYSDYTDTVYNDPYDDAFVFDEEVEPEDEMDDTSAVKQDEKGSIGPSRQSVEYRHMSEKEEELPELKFLDLLKMNKPDWLYVIIGVTMSALIATIYSVLSIVFSEVLRIFGLNDPSEIERETLKVIGGFIGLAVAIGITYFLSSFFLSVAGERLTKRLRLKSFNAMLRQEIAWFDKKANSTGALVARLASDASAVKSATGIRLGSIAEVVFGLIPAVIISFEASWELSLVMLFSIPAVALFNFFQIKLLQGRSHKNKKRIEESGQVAVESINNMRTVAGLGLEHTFCEKYSNLLKGPFRNAMKSVFSQALVLAVSQSIVLFIFAAGYSLGAFLVVEGRITYDDIFRVYAIVVFTAHTISRATSSTGEAAKAHTAAARITSLLNRKPLIDATSENGAKLEAIGDNTEIAAKSLHFSYPLRPNVKVLQGFDVTVKHGQTLALVGPSGCGKSTIVSLLERFYDPLSGTIAIQNTDVQELNLRWLREQIGIVLQEPLLFDCSIAENIKYGALFKTVSDAEVIDAAKAANIHEFIESLPKGYETNVGSKGTQLSGGQKQRISIARALIRDPKILLLDEATSALDTESEKVVQEALDKARKGRTCIVIAHRLSTIYNSDMIAVIHNGQIIESGTHAELMAMKGAYYDLNTINH